MYPSMLKRLAKVAVAGWVGLLAMSCNLASGFTLGGPSMAWQTVPFGYDRLGQGTGETPQNLGDEYRVNVPTIYYTYEASFLDYFGAKGVEEVDKAIKYFNDLPPFSSMSTDLSEYPNDTLRENFKASTFQLTDLKSTAMSEIMSQLGVIAPEIHIWDVRDRVTQPNQQCPFYDFVVIKRNFDPVTWEPSSYVNGVLYTYVWLISCSPAPDRSYPVASPVDPVAFSFRSVAGDSSVLLNGSYFNGLTRDDVGALRYIYRTDNYNKEQLPPDVFAGLGGSGGSPWEPVNTTNVAVGAGDTTALRAGINKLHFVRKDYDSLLGTFYEGITNNFSVQVVTNGGLSSQSFSRAVLRPDLIFSAGTLQVDLANGIFTVIQHTVPAYASINITDASVNGPGSLIIGDSRTSIDIRFTKIGPAFSASYPSFLDEGSLLPEWRWGSFDGSTNDPVLYPSGSSIKQLEQQVLGSSR
ncbi:hypothetical protein GC207_01160 [bacterium]|nr:hypothetical protein [bacterium]